MAFAQTTPTTTTSVNKNRFVASLNSKKSAKATAWLNLTDSFVSATFNKTIKEVEAEEVIAKLSKYYDNDYVYLHVVDTTANKELVDPSEF